jgi:hypothetical protein
MYFKNPEGRKYRVCARERRHCCGLQSQWCQMMTSLIFEAHAIIAHVRAVTELPGLMISTTFTGGALLVGANQEHDRILRLLLLLLFSIFGPHRHYHFLYLYNKRKFFWALSKHSTAGPTNSLLSLLTMFWGQCLLWVILCYSQSGDHPQEDLAKFGCKLNVKEF